MKRFPRATHEYLEHLLSVLNAIEINLAACLGGNRAGALSLSPQLYKLLCDRQGGISLIERVIPNFSLYPMINQISGSVDYLLYDPIRTSFDNGQITVELVDTSKRKITLSHWLEQVLFIATVEEKGVKITIRNFLYQIRNSEGAHLLNNIDETMTGIKNGMGTYRIGNEVYPQHYLLLLIISSYVSEEIHLQLPK